MESSCLKPAQLEQTAQLQRYTAVLKLQNAAEIDAIKHNAKI